MEKSRLLRLLRSFSPAEIQGLKKYVRTPFFNQRTEVPTLLELLVKSLKTGKAAPDKATAFREVFGGTAHNDHRLRLAMSFLYQISLQYLAVQDFMSDTPRYQRSMAAMLRRRGLHEHFAPAHAEAKDALYRQPERNADFFEEDYRLRLEQYRFDHTQQPAIDPAQLQGLSDALESTFLARKLWQACFLHAHHIVSGATYDQGLLTAALAQAVAPKNLAVPAIAIYYHCYRALTEPDDRTHFQAFKTLVLTQGALFPADEMRDLFVLGINLCIRQYNAGNPDYLAEQFDFYREGLAKKYLLSEGTLSRYTYLNAVTSALVLHQFDWAEHFIHDYREYLPETYQESLYSFNLARLEYLRQRFGPALRLLQKADYKDVLLHLAAKMLQLKIYYESAEFDLLESHLQALRAFLRRKKNMGYLRENYLNTVHFTQKLLETNLLAKDLRSALRQEIEETKAVAEKEWLLLQVPH
jgi:hypothetical protein